jgi:hypothetical protein
MLIWQSRISTAFILLLALCSMALGGCSVFGNGGAPEQSFNVDKDLEQLAKRYSDATSIEKYYAGEQTKSRRNQFISGRMVMMNIRYVQFVRQTTTSKQFLDAATDILVLSLNLAGTAVDGASVKTTLAAIAAGVTGSKIAVDKHYFYEKTMPALVAAMNAQRKVALVPIMQGMQKEVIDYPFEQAIVDLNAYYEAGTFIGAINAIQVDASAKEKLADQEISRFVRDAAGDLLQDFVNAPEPQRTANRAELGAWLEKNHIAPDEAPFFIKSELFREARARAAADLKLPRAPASAPATSVAPTTSTAPAP